MFGHDPDHSDILGKQTTNACSGNCHPPDSTWCSECYHKLRREKNEALAEVSRLKRQIGQYMGFAKCVGVAIKTLHGQKANQIDPNCRECDGDGQQGMYEDGTYGRWIEPCPSCFGGE